MTHASIYLRWLLLCLLVWLGVGCRGVPGVDAEVGATVTAKPPTLTPTPSPTATPLPTFTPYPTIAIPMLTPTITPTLAATATPQPTPMPQALGLPVQVIPEPFGVEIHFTHPLEGEMEKLVAGGFKFVRMDLFWSEIERQPGVYNFEAYDSLVRTLRRHNLRLIFILDYNNTFHDGGHSPHTDAGRAAFVRFVKTAVRRYRGNDIIWEVWNEPNLPKFWSPSPNATNYARLAIAVSDAIHQVDPTAWVVGPSTSGFDRPFWEEMARIGALKHFDAISIHPYRTTMPETALEDYLWLRGLLYRYSPEWRVPVVSSEWGYYNTPGGYTAEQQAQFLPRQWLFNMAHDVELSIWYDWRNDGHDPHDTEQNFGTVTYDFEPKLSYYAAQTLIETLRDYRFMRRIPLENPDDYLLLFQKEASVALAGWTTDAAHPVVLPLPAEQIQTLGLSSESGVLQGEGGGVTVELGAAPRYLLLGSGPGGPVALLGGWRPLHTINVVDLSRNEGVPVIVHNPFPGPLEAELQLTAEGHMLGLTWISVPPGETALFRIPVQIDESLRGSVSAKIAFITPDGSPQLIQSALVWLLIVPEP